MCLAQSAVDETLVDLTMPLRVMGPPPFANDPIRGPRLLLFEEDIQTLNGANFLSTTLLDYIIQCVVPKDIPDNIIGVPNWF